MAGKRLNGMRVAVIAADGFEQIELTSPADHLEKHGAEVDVISLRPGRIKGMNSMIPGKNVKVDRTIFTASVDDYDALLLPGGHFNPDFLRQSASVLKFVREFDAAGKPIAVICHGPWILISAGCVKDRSLTSWPGIRDDVRNAGGNWSDEAVVHDGNWVSSRGPHDLIQFNRAMVTLFEEHRAAARGRRTSLLPTLGWLAAGAAVAAAIYGTNTAGVREEEEEAETVGSPIE